MAIAIPAILVSPPLVFPSNLCTSGLSSMVSGQLKPMGLDLQVQTTRLAPYLMHCSAISSAE